MFNLIFWDTFSALCKFTFKLAIVAAVIIGIPWATDAMANAIQSYLSSVCW